MSTVGLIWAQAANGVIGDRGRLPWHLPEDLARFKALTTGSTVVMGRATWESLPERNRPLPGRRNVVLTRRAGWAAEGALAAGSVEEALALAGGDAWVIGGARAYEAAMAHADRLEVTELEDAFAGDVRAPALGAGWRLARRDPVDGWRTSRTGLRYRDLSYARG
ncbi:dihydrofolate reductase [Quadrisphaera sp. DSM 44207]|uniref:dihydrofolate reductase n=1 Tax=Quadrisphaera sp. DSM 44207 TaxID=1881057 RepID=UPI00088252B8|nr:dihydrofolate reductase [Quadrisphaera sp. DSM 44207]SDQ77513.1 dihydrofolate reductase [Quadrisphaera sp. DSM 44207]